jgi:hypothetical protein
MTTKPIGPWWHVVLWHLHLCRGCNASRNWPDP